MKAADVYVGRIYRAKISGTVVEVRITGKSSYGGWVAVNLSTNREVRIKTGAKLRGEVSAA